MSIQNQNINNNTDEKNKGFMPFVLVFGGIIAALILLKLLLGFIM